MMVTCKEYVQEKKGYLRKEVSMLSKKPHLCVIQIGDDVASNSYVKGKYKDAEEIGIIFEHIHFKAHENISEDEIIRIIDSCNNSEQVDGIIIQLPIPDKYDVQKLQSHISPNKDVDGFRQDSLFTACTPKGIIDYLKYNDINVAGKICTVVGRSDIVGKPLVNLLIEAGATTINCNSRTPDVRFFTKCSDIVISAIGQANYFNHDYFHNGQILIDVGINRDNNDKLCGDICEYAKEGMFLATPVPGGVGVLTRIALMENVLKAYKMK